MHDEARLPLELELPNGEHRAWLLAAFANLVKRRGYETLVAAPILLPRSEYFPDRWQPTLGGARRLLRRLMHYAGLGELDLRLRGWVEKPLARSGVVVRDEESHAAAWFDGIHDGVCDFGLELDQLRHEESLVASLAHEVAHAYRDHHGLVVRDAHLEEKLTDLTTVYLGFGVFALNASLVVQTGGYDAAGQRLLYEVRSGGYLSPAELALLLSVQLAIRAHEDEQRAVRRELAANHAALLGQGLAEFSADLHAARALLGVPEPAIWPPPRAVDELPALVEGGDGDADPEDEDAADERGDRHASEIAFRVKTTKAASLTLMGIAASGALAIFAGSESFGFYGASAIGGALGHWAGRALRRHECSSCRSRVLPDQQRCARCGAQLVGEIGSLDERLEAEESYRAAHAEAEPALTEKPADPLMLLWTAMLVAWGLRRGFIADAASDAVRELARRAERRDFDTAALSTAWADERELFQEEAMRFAHYYLYEAAELQRQDFTILSTANELNDRPANYDRFAVILDRRFEAWKSAQ